MAGIVIGHSKQSVSEGLPIVYSSSISVKFNCIIFIIFFFIQFQKIFPFIGLKGFSAEKKTVLHRRWKLASIKVQCVPERCNTYCIARCGAGTARCGVMPCSGMVHCDRILCYPTAANNELIEFLNSMQWVGMI